jgi:replication factor A1
MHKTKGELYERVKDLKTKEEFEEEIKKRFSEYDELVDEDTLALLILDELGRNKQVVTKIGDLKPDGEYTVVGRVINIYEPRVFFRKNGDVGKVVNLDIGDETGICRLVLWDKDVDLVEKKDIKEGTTIRLINGYTKEGFSGLEINLGRWGVLEVDDEVKIHEIKGSKCVRGVLISREPTRAFFKEDGEFGFVTTIKIKEEDGEKQLVLWGDKVKEIQGFGIGDRVVIKNVAVRRNAGKVELHVSNGAVIQRC